MSKKRVGPPNLERLLDMTEQQKSDLAQLRKEQHEAVRPNLEEQRRLGDQLNQALESATPDALAVGKAAIALHAGRERLKALDDGLHQRVLDLLDAEQRQKLQLWSEMSKRPPHPPDGPPQGARRRPDVPSKGYASAYAGLADTWNYLAASTFGAADPRESLPKAKQAAQKALELDDTLGEAHASLGSVLFRYDLDFERGERELRRALELSPGYAQARQWLSLLCAVVGRRAEAILEARRALDVDPRPATLRRNLAVVLYFSRRFEEAEREERRALADPQMSGFREFLAEILLAQGRPREAIAELAAVFGPEPAADGPRALWAAALAAAGEREKARAVLRQLQADARRRYIPPRSLVIVLALLGESDEAFRVLDLAVEERSDFVHLLKVHPLLDGLRADGRFDSLLRRVGLPPG